jgi:hypothetical protein
MHVSTSKTKTEETKAEVKNAPAAKNDKQSNPRSDVNVERSETGATQPAARPITTIDDSNVMACYANMCRVSSTPEELILDLGLNPNPYAQTDTTVEVSQRIIMNHFTAKRLLAALSATIQRHEQAFGVLEIDVNKRVRKN